MVCNRERGRGTRTSVVRGAPHPGLRAAPLLVLLAWGVSGCALLEPLRPKICEQQYQEIARLQQTLAEKDAEIENLHAQKNVQAEVLTQTTGEVARAEVKLRRLATQADAASHLAEVEVALQGLWAQTHTPHAAAQLVQSQRILDAGGVSFARGDYAAAVELAAQSRELIDMVTGRKSAAAARGAVEVPFQVPVALRTRIDSNLREQPGRAAAVLAVLPEGTPLQALAYRGEWLRVRTTDGRTGWVFGPLLEAPEPGAE